MSTIFPTRGGGRTHRTSKKPKQRGGHLIPLQPAEVTGLGTPVITQHLPPGSIQYDSNPANIQGQTGGTYMGRVLAHPRSAVGGGRKRTKKSKRTKKNKRTKKSKRSGRGRK